MFTVNCSKSTGLRRASLPLVAAGLMILAGAVRAEEWQILGARALGMGGAQVANPRGALASYWNPAYFARESFLDVDFSTGTAIVVRQDILEDADRIRSHIEGMGAEFANILTAAKNGAALTRSQLREALLLYGEEIPNLAAPGGAVAGNSHLSLAVRWARYGLSARVFANYAAVPDVDAARLSLNGDPTVAVRVANIVGAGQDRSGSLSASGQSLADSLAGAGYGFTQDQAEEYVYQSELAGLSAGTAVTRDRLVEVARQTGTGYAGAGTTVGDNATRFSGRGIALAEYSFTAGLPLERYRTYLGANLKLLSGRTYENTVAYTDFRKSGEDTIDDLLNRQNSKEGAAVSADVGILASPVPNVWLGVTARDIPNPSFDYASGGKYDLDPQVRAGVAWFPIEFLTLAVDYDVTRNGSSALADYHSRHLAVGTEVDLWHIVYPRLGFYRNTAGGSFNDTVYTLGLGVNANIASDFKLSFDVAYATSRRRQDFQSGLNIPDQGGAVFSFNLERRF
ncbi:MAG: conjugal transfer protein TraF [Planctomycetota bacterium]